ncbi:hypothetical protein BDF22DRAFT_696484, partial [Syncephalis plumigaleata]
MSKKSVRKKSTNKSNSSNPQENAVVKQQKAVVNNSNSTTIDDIFAGKITSVVSTSDNATKQVTDTPAINKKRKLGKNQSSHSDNASNHDHDSVESSEVGKKQKKRKKAKKTEEEATATTSTTTSTVESSVQETVIVFNEPTGEKSRQEERKRKRNQLNKTGNVKNTGEQSSKSAIDDDTFADTRGSQSSRYTEDGLPIYDAKILRIGEGGDTDQCPFDCECCF